MQEDKRMKVKKGWLAVRVGLDDDEAGGGGFRRFVIPISYLHHPLFQRLLESAQEVYGFHSSGPLKLPCSVDDFLHLLWRMERESQSSHSSQHRHRHQQQQHHHHHHSFSLHSCT